VQESDIGVHDMKLIVALGRTEYPKLEVTFQLIVQTATCNCNLL